MKFIVFFSGYDQLHTKEKEVSAWFKTAYTDMKINTLQVTGETYANAEQLGKYKSRPGNNLDIVDNLHCTGSHGTHEIYQCT